METYPMWFVAMLVGIIAVAWIINTKIKHPGHRHTWQPVGKPKKWVLKYSIINPDSGKHSDGVEYRQTMRCTECGETTWHRIYGEDE